MIISAQGKQAEQQLVILGTPEVPIYLLSYSNGYALIEGGISVLAPRVLAQLKAHIGDLALVTHWFITHAHYDHCGLLPYLTALLPKVKIYASAETARAFQSERAVAMIEKLNAQLTSDEDLTALSEHKIALNDLPIVVLQDNDVIALDADRKLRVLATPGHAKCVLTFFDSATETAFVSDVLGEFIAASHWCPLIFDDVNLYRLSIAKIQNLKPKALALAHHVILTDQDATSAPGDALRSIDEFTALAASFLTEEKSPSKTAERLSKHFYWRSGDFVPAQLHYQSMLLMLKLLLSLS